MATDLLWFLAQLAVGAAWLAFLAAMKGSCPDPVEREEDC